MTKASNDLADALYGKWVDEPFRSVRASFREVAHEAEAMGAKRALEDIAAAADETLESSDRWVKTWLLARVRAGQIGKGDA
jgi:hypothetical protein